MPTQQPFPASHSHLKHHHQHLQQLPVRPASSSAGVLTPSSMSDSPQISRRKPPEDSRSMRMGATAQQSQLLPHGGGGGGGANMRRRESKGKEDVAKRGMEDTDSTSQGSLSSVNPNNPDSGFNSSDLGVGTSAPPEESKGDLVLGRWMKNFEPSGAPRGAGGAGNATPRGVGPAESLGGTSGEGNVGQEYIDYLDHNIGVNNNFTCGTYSIPGGEGEGEGGGKGEYRGKYLSPGGMSRFSSHGHRHRFRDAGFGFERSRFYVGSGPLDSTEESNSDSFRSVIDDLTIKNKKLKRRLKKLEGLHGGNLQDQKLFEIRVHGLSLPKKQELERLLQGFAANLDSPGTASASNSNNSRNADSAYASNPRSGSGSIVPSSQPKPRSAATPMSTSSSERAASRVRNAPLQADTEKYKMRAVVRRLEKLFTGWKSGGPIGQRQDGNGDCELRRKIPEEGAREAPIMSPSQDKRIAEFGDSTAGVNPDERQRPTRPTDLDPFRLHQADENIEYLSNMTLSSAKDNTKLEGLGDGWFYLNLLTNMAQLHQINVTMTIVRKAIAEMSKKLELSPDGTRVRWRGGSEGTRLSSSGSSGGAGSPSSREGSPDTWSKSSPESKDLLSVHPPTSGSGRSSRGLSLTSPPGVEDKSHYEPIFARGRFSDDDSSSAMSTSIDSYDLLKRSSSGDSTGLSGSSSKRPGHSLNGPIIYYGGGNFCTDLSAQKMDADASYPVLSRPGYELFTNSPIGEKQRGFESPTKSESPLFARANVATSSDESMLDEDGDSDVGLQFSPRFSSPSSEPATPPTPMELEASGIGGVTPEDNFAINVRTKHFFFPQNAKGALPLPRANASKSRILNMGGHYTPMSVIEAFAKGEEMKEEEEEEEEEGEGEEEEEEEGSESGEASEEQASVTSSNAGERSPVFCGHKFLRPVVISSKTIKLAPSQLPPAGCIFPSSDDQSDSDSGSGVGPQSSGSEDYFHLMGQLHADIYGNHGGDYQDMDILARSGLRMWRPGGVNGAGDVGSSAATAGDASGVSSPIMLPADKSTDLPKVNLLGVGITWEEGGDNFSVDEGLMSSSTGDERVAMHAAAADRRSLKRGRISGASSENALPLHKKTPRK